MSISETIAGSGMLFAPNEQPKTGPWRRLLHAVRQRFDSQSRNVDLSPHSAADGTTAIRESQAGADLISKLPLEEDPPSLQHELQKPAYIIEVKVAMNEQQTEWMPVAIRGFSQVDKNGNTVNLMLCYLYPDRSKPLSNACHALVKQVHAAGSQETTFQIFGMTAAENGVQLKQRISDELSRTVGWVSERSEETGIAPEFIITKIDEQITNALKKHGDTPDFGNADKKEYKSQIAQTYMAMMQQIGLVVKPELGANGPQKMDSGVNALLSGPQFSQEQIEAQMAKPSFNISGCTRPDRAGEMIQPIRIFGFNVDIGDGRGIRVMMRFEPADKSAPSSAGAFVLTQHEIADGRETETFLERINTSFVNYSQVEYAAWKKIMAMAEQANDRRYVED